MIEVGVLRPAPDGAASTRRKVLIVTDQVPGHDVGFQKSGHAQYLSSFVAHFQLREFEIVLVALRPKVDFVRLPVRELGYRVVSPALDVVRGVVVVRSPRVLARALAWQGYARLPQRLQALADALRTRLRRSRGFAHDLGAFVSDEERAYVREIAAVERPDVLLYDGIFNYCGRFGPATPWIVTHEVKHERAASFADAGVPVRPANFSAGVERAILEDAGNVVAIQWDDAGEFRRLVPAARIVVVPVSVAPPAHAAPVAREGGALVFVGSGSFHNYDGLAWFLESCWPKIRAARPGARLDVYGTICGRLRDVPAGVGLHGVVGELTEVYARAAGAVVPLRIGSGLKVKLIEALAHGVPIVTTPVGAQGLMQLTPRPFALAAADDEFVAACVRVLSEPALRTALSGAALACAARFEPVAAFAEFDAASGLAASGRS